MKVTATIDQYRDGKGWEVKFEWDVAVDRPHTYSMVVAKRELAERIAKCANDQKMFENVSIETDVYGKTYVQASSRVMAKYANADLKRLGY